MATAAMTAFATGGTNVPQALSTLATSAKTIRAQHIIAERAKWREKIRSAVSDAIIGGSTQQRQALWITLKLNTNPTCAEDAALVELAKSNVEKALSPEELEELIDRTALLLKHDWERAKNEAGADLIVRRITYAEFCELRSGGLLVRSLKSWSGQLPL